MLFISLWAYRTSIKTTIIFTPFQLVQKIEAILLIECEIPSLKLAIKLLPNTSFEEEQLLFLHHLDEYYKTTTLANESHKKWVKV